MNPYQDPEGHALVDAIHARKARSVKVMTHEGWREVGQASIISLDAIPETSPFDGLFKEPGRLVPTKMPAPVQMQLQDVSHEFMAMLLGYGSVEEMREAGRKRQELRQMAGKWARGYGKRVALEKIRGRAVITDWLAGIRGQEYPWAESITWSCAKPTAT